MNDATALETGKLIVELLNLKPIKRGNQKGRFSTSFGTKTEEGLARSIKRIIMEVENVKLES